MRNAHTSEEISSFSEFYQFLQTIYKKVLSNNQVTDKFDEEETIICLKLMSVKKHSKN